MYLNFWMSSKKGNLTDSCGNFGKLVSFLSADKILFSFYFHSIFSVKIPILLLECYNAINVSFTYKKSLSEILT